jgi:hypothetical protein
MTGFGIERAMSWATPSVRIVVPLWGSRFHMARAACAAETGTSTLVVDTEKEG